MTGSCNVSSLSLRSGLSVPDEGDELNESQESVSALTNNNIKTGCRFSTECGVELH